MKKILNVITFTFIGLTAMAQGQPSAKVFSNFNYRLSDEDNNFKAFEVNETYLGYSYALSDEFTTKITFDVGNNSAGSQYTAFLKIASVSWKANDNMNQFWYDWYKEFQIYGKSLGT